MENVAANGTGSGSFKGSVIYLNPGSIMNTGRTDESDWLNKAINIAVEAGLHVIVSAGNENSDECISIAPSKAFIVGASTDDDKKAYFSNFGPCISVFAPGQLIEPTTPPATKSTTRIPSYKAK